MIEYTVRVYGDGHKIWRLNGQIHREDGPAVVGANGGKLWFLDGKEVTEEEHKKRTSKASCQGKVVVIDGIEYELKEV